jgi:hypothetical protein
MWPASALLHLVIDAACIVQPCSLYRASMNMTALLMNTNIQTQIFRVSLRAQCVCTSESGTLSATLGCSMVTLGLSACFDNLIGTVPASLTLLHSA